MNKKINDAIAALYNVVGSTLGPNGNLVMHKKNVLESTVTKDGVTAAKYVFDDDDETQMIIEFIKEACNQTYITAGDGTTSAIVIANALIAAFDKMMETSNINKRVAIEKILRGKEAIMEIIAKELTKKCEGLKQVYDIAKISANGDEEMAKLVGEAFEHSGKSGTIMYEKAFSKETNFSTALGMRFDNGAKNARLLGKHTEWVGEKCLVFMIDEKIDNIQDYLMAIMIMAMELKAIGKSNSVLVMSKEIDSTIMLKVLEQCHQGFEKVMKSGETVQIQLDIMFTELPLYHTYRYDAMVDLAACLQGTFINEEEGHNIIEIAKDPELLLSHLGLAKKIVVTEHATTFEFDKGHQPAIHQRIAEVKKIKTVGDIAANNKTQRLERLEGKMSYIKMGGTSEAHMEEKIARMDDSVKSVRAALKTGYVIGGGINLLNAINKYQEKLETSFEYSFWELVKDCVLRKILINEYQEDLESVDEIIKMINALPPSAGYNGYTGEIVNLFEAGVINSYEAEMAAFGNAVDVVTLLLKTDHVIADTPSSQNRAQY